ncbi:hypothetical protein TROLL_2 [Bacillus phage Troll]|uniref:Uncharacterized protein n=1 Tax=Bacillus phage Troll TaxID=1382932 RepID=S5Y045_9CAUD|nr:hypothetical protein TROLL_2 [Bacillus phage Troll]AGT13444.1 hypothetical protein TROLL_2 [Bacillus phage Troll]
MKKMHAHEMELGLEVVVEMKGGITLEGKIMDYTMSREIIWVETSEDFYQVNTEVDNVFYAPTKPAEVAPERAPEGLKDLSAIKAEYKEELSLLWNKDVEYHNVMVFNSDEDDVEVWDCEFNTKMEDGERITIYFGTFYNEKDALKCARDMRTKLKRSYDIDSKVTVYTC